MLRLRNLFFILAIALGASLSVHAAITPITETEFGTSAKTGTNSYAPDNSISDTGCDIDTLPSAYGNGNISCVYNNAKDGRGCISTTYCKSGSEVTVRECPSTLSYSLTDTSGISKLSSLEYCDGYRNGVKAVWFYENPNQCSIHGITNETYLSSLNAVDTCDDAATAKSCVNADGASVNYCELSSTTGYQRCPSSNTSYSPYPHSCGASSNGDAIICYIECGNGIYCAGYTCDISSLPSCSTLEEEKIAEGYYSSGISDYYDEGKGFIHQCAKDGSVKYMGFYCQGYYTQTDCTSDANNGTIGNSCSYITASGTPQTVYECTCGTWQTLSEYCNNDASCMSITSGIGNPCWLDSAKVRTRGVSEPRYASFRSADQLCSVYNTDYIWSTANAPSEYTTTPVQCYINEGDADTTTAYLYCGGCYKTSNEMQTICDTANGAGASTVSSTIICTAQTAGNPAYADGNPVTTYCGCDCDTTKFKTLEEWCVALFPDDADTCKLQAVSDGSECHSRPKAGGAGYHTDDTVLVPAIKCSSQYKSKAEWCEENASQILEGYSCEDDYIGIGTACKIDAGGNVDNYKYTSYGLGCPTGPDVTAKEKTDECLLSGETKAYYTNCFAYDATTNTTKTKYICHCPPSYGTECNSPYMSRGGTACRFDTSASGSVITKYSSCDLTCNTTYAAEPSQDLYSCSDIGDYVATIRGGSTSPEMCVLATDSNRPKYYICACPSNFLTLDKWCDQNYNEEGLSSAEECVKNFIGIGASCKLDIESDSYGNPTKLLTKYVSYARYCPSDRPLYYSESDCTFIGGEYEYSCLDTNNTERVVCQCPTNWYDKEGNSISGTSCESVELGGKEYDAESSGNYCDFGGSENLKYEECTVSCNALLTDEDVAVPNAYTYLSPTESQTPTQMMCNQTMGNGAVLGFGGQAFCSLNNTKMYPCYCPASFQECKQEDNLIAAENATICKVNGVTYYSSCIETACNEESYNVAIVDTEEDAKNFGPGAEIVRCSKDGETRYQVTCNTKTYNDSCEYPYTAPKDYTSVTDASSAKSWCKYSKDKSGKMASDSTPHFKSGACSITKTLGECGKSIAQAPTGANYTIFVASAESECTSKYGPGIKTQLCEYGKEQGYKRAYNCYYNPADFKYTTANCGVRHNLSGNYIIINGKKYWNECKCTSAYQHHKFNCGGMLSGNPCQQEITQSMINSDASLKEAVADGYDLDGVTLPYYPYCECSSDYTEICDEDGSGRYKGVGTACNGKYTACECVPDKLPDNWTDNYYGCPGGKKPTGVWKDNGCGKKYYQCQVVECTWEYTEMCEAPLIPVGQSCQDNEGNIGGYKACTCPSDYITCGAGQVGEGEPCNLKGVSYYKSCKSQETCNSLSTETCTGPLQIGINPCTRDDITYFESCVCANGYDKVCGEGEVGVGNYCEIEGTKYYKECVEPEDNECTEKHVTACDTNQESYSPCVGRDANGKQIVKYLCRCPTNWQTCSETGPAANSEKCTFPKDGTTYYSKCDASEGCSAYQDLTYKVCTAAQTGDGGSCSSTVIETIDGEEVETTVIKHATCKDSGNCLTNGFRYSCSGYDTAFLGEACIDDQGNKLYKECPCPSSYVSCGNSNATKGSKCTPLKSDGTFGSTVYSSCVCDRSKYKYTCKADTQSEPYNLGIKAPSSGASYCEVEEKVYVYITDEDGNKVIKTDEDGNKVTTTEKVKYYTNCECKEDYAYTCQNTGEILPDGYNKDYCKINSTKFYKGCDCSAEYKYTADDCRVNDGQTVDTSRGSCTTKGDLDAVDNGDVPLVTGETGSGSGHLENTTYYKACICKNNFSLDCSSTLYEQEGLPFCQLSNDSTKLYAQCKCSASTSKTCSPSGKNKGIIPDTGTICEEKVAGNGSYTSTPKYTSCACNASYSITAETCDNDINGYYNQYNEDYCDLSENTSGDTGKYYKRCACNNILYDNTVNAGNGSTPPDAATYCAGKGLDVVASFTLGTSDYPAFCPEQTNASGSSDNHITYRPNRGLCCSSTALDGYIQFDSSTYSSLSEFYQTYGEDSLRSTFKSKCGHSHNAVVTLDCSGKPFYKCSNATVAASSTWYTQEECTDADRNEAALLTVSGTPQTITESWLSGIDVYPNCSCPSNFNETQSCKQRTVSSLVYTLKSGTKAPVCFNMGRHYDRGDYYLNSSSYVCGNVNANDELCIDATGNRKYDWSKCTCDQTYYTVVDTDGMLDHCRNTTDSSKSCHHKYCIDSKGVYHDSSGHKSDKGETSVDFGKQPKCSVTNGKVKCS